MRNFFYLCVSSIFYGFFVIQGRQIFSICFNHVLNDVVDSCVDVFISILFLIMEKLLELLNNPEFEPSSKIEHWTEISVQNCDYLIISKNRGFIRKLVEKDLIDFESMSGNGKIISYLTDVADYKRNDIKENLVLMLLSIQDDPIKYLISILK